MRREEYSLFVNTFKNQRQSFKKRLGTVTAVNTGTRTLDVIVGADQTEYKNVKYYASFVPVVGADVWVETDGLDMVAVGTTATQQTIEEQANELAITLPAVAGIVRKITNAQSISASTDTKVTFNSVISDPYAMWDATNNYFVLPYAGFWSVDCSISWASTTNAQLRRTAILRGTDPMARTASRFADYVNPHSVSAIISGSVNDQISISVWTDFAHNVLAGDANTPAYFSVNYLGKSS